MVHLDEFFGYDGLHRLTSADRGDLNGGKTAISTLAFAQDSHGSAGAVDEQPTPLP